MGESLQLWDTLCCFRFYLCPCGQLNLHHFLLFIFLSCVVILTIFLKGFMIVSLQKNRIHKHDQFLIILMSLHFRAWLVKQVHNPKLFPITLKYMGGARNMILPSYSYVWLEKVKFRNKSSAIICNNNIPQQSIISFTISWNGENRDV